MSTNVLFILRRRWPLLVGLPLLTVISVLLLSPSAAPALPKYTTTVYLAGDPAQVGTIDLEQATVAIRQPKVAKVAAEQLGEKPKDLEDFTAQLKTKVDAKALTIRLSAQDVDEDRVRPFVAAFADAFLAINEFESEGTYQANVDAATEERDAAQRELSDFVVRNAAELNGATPNPVLTDQRTTLVSRVARADQRIVDVKDARPVAPYFVSGQEKVRLVPADKLQLPATKGLRATLAFLFAIVGAIGLVAILERLNPRIDTPKAAEAIVGAPVLAMVPVMRGKRRRSLERSDLAQFTGPFAESFRAMRSHLDFRSTTEGLDHPPCVMIVSSTPSEGKTTTTAFLALSYAEAAREVVVVGADFRRPSVHALFGVPSKPGLSSRLVADEPAGKPEEMVRSIVKRDPKTGVRVIPSGPATDRVTGLLGDLSAVTSAATESGCTVVVDTAPIVVANDAIDFLPFVDWVVVVVRVGKTTERSLRQTISSLELNDAKIAGCVMVGSIESSDAKRYYYSYYKVDEAPVPSAPGANRAGTAANADTTPDVVESTPAPT